MIPFNSTRVIGCANRSDERQRGRGPERVTLDEEATAVVEHRERYGAQRTVRHDDQRRRSLRFEHGLERRDEQAIQRL
jgi:hypothetical protein